MWFDIKMWYVIWYEWNEINDWQIDLIWFDGWLIGGIIYLLIDGLSYYLLLLKLTTKKRSMNYERCENMGVDQLIHQSSYINNSSY